MPPVMSIRNALLGLTKLLPALRKDRCVERGAKTPHEPGKQRSSRARLRCDAELEPPQEPSTDPILDKFKLANQAQREEILKHRDRLSRLLGRPVSLDEAARDWILCYAAEWRERFEAEWNQPVAG